MARLFSCGFELQDNAAGAEFSSNGISSGGVTTSVFRSGAASFQINPTAQFSWIGHTFKGGGASATQAYSRVYVNFGTLPPSGTPEVMGFWDAVGVTRAAGILINSSGQFICTDGNGNPLTGTSAAITANTWHCIEMTAIGGVPGTFIARLDGVIFCNTATGSIFIFDSVYFGTPGTAGTYNCYYDDWAINDTSGSNQNSWPGFGAIIHLRPNAAGDNNAFSVAVGGTAGAANNFTRVQEIAPNDATNYNADITNGDNDDFNIDNTPTSISAGDNINVVQVGIRFSGLSAISDAAFKARCKKASAGTVAQGIAISPASTTWLTNAVATPFNYSLTLYADPDGKPWTKATLDTAQIGYGITTTGVNAAAISTVWMLVESQPGGGEIPVLSQPTNHYRPDIISI